jgi:hypothetical protein
VSQEVMTEDNVPCSIDGVVLKQTTQKKTKVEKLILQHNL